MEPGKAARLGRKAAAMSVVRCIVRSHLHHPHQIDDSEKKHPHNVEKVPVQADNRQFARCCCIDAALFDLVHEHDHPQNAERNVATVRANQSKEGAEKGASLHRGAYGDIAHKLAHFETDERHAEQRCHGEPADESAAPSFMHGVGGKAASETAGEQDECFSRKTSDIKDLMGCRTSIRIATQHQVGGKETGKQDHVS